MARTVEKVRTERLSRYYRNAREGDIGLISQSLDALGQYKPIVVNRGSKTGRENEVLVGNHTLQAAIALGWDQVDVWWVDVDEETARKIVLVDNRSSDMATYDEAALLDLLSDAQSDLDGTGYDLDDLDTLAASIARASELTGSDGSGGGGDPVISYTLVFDDEGQQDRWYRWLKWLKTQNGGETIAERIDNFLAAIDRGEDPA